MAAPAFVTAALQTPAPPRARVLVACTSNDALNLEIGLTAQALAAEAFVQAALADQNA